MPRAFKQKTTRQNEKLASERVASNSLPVGILVFNEDAELVSASNHTFQIFEQDIKDPEGKRFGEMFRCEHTLGKGRVCGKMQACSACGLMESVKHVLTTGESVTGTEAVLDFEIGGRITTKWLSANISSMTEGMERFAMVSITDITAKRNAEHELSLFGISDELTDLYTRRYVLKKMDELIQFNWPEAFPVSMVLMSVDAQQDKTRDITLKCLAEVLRETAQSTDIIGRYDENVMIGVFVKTDAEKAHDIIAEMLEAYKEKTAERTGESYTFSAGILSVGSVAGSICDTKDYIHDTEALLEKAKEIGGGRIEWEKEIF
mgnify:CR=1 FL=1